MKHTTILLITLFGICELQNHVSAEEQTPILDLSTKVGRIEFMEDTGGNLVFPPILFSQNFSCDKRSNICTLQVFNAMNPEEVSQVKALRAAGYSTFSLKPELFQSLISHTPENIVSDLIEMKDAFHSLGNLALIENPYASSIFRTKLRNAESLMNQYNAEGIGTIVLQYEVKGKTRDFSIRIPTTWLRSFIREQVNERSLSFSELKSLIRQDSSQFNIKGYTLDDSTVIIAYHLTERLFSSKNNQLTLDQKKILRFEALKMQTLIIGETFQNSTKTCVMRLPIQKNAVLTTNCEVNHAI